MPQPPSRDLLWPGDARAGAAFGDEAMLAAMVRVERAHLAVLVEVGIAPAEAADDLSSVTLSVPALADASEAAGNPVVPLVAALRERLPEPAATWVHQGLTSQDVLDSALMLCAREAVEAVLRSLGGQVTSMTALAARHRDTPMVARTLTQPAIGITFGTRVAGWLTGVLDAADALSGATAWLRVQAGGAAGTLAATTELAHARGLADPARVAARAADMLADRLSLARSAPWHTSRRPVTILADALTACTDAWGRIARDVLESARAEIGELREPAGNGRGGSSTMPDKRNPVLSVLIRRAALAAPALTATLHQAAAEATEERSDGAWHVEWDTLRTLARRAVVAGSQTGELLAGLEVDAGAMAGNLARHRAGHGGIDPEQRAKAALLGAAPAETYTGTADLIVDTVLSRAQDVSAALAERLVSLSAAAGTKEER